MSESEFERAQHTCTPEAYGEAEGFPDKLVLRCMAWIGTEKRTARKDQTVADRSQSLANKSKYVGEPRFWMLNGLRNEIFMSAPMPLQECH